MKPTHVAIAILIKRLAEGGLDYAELVETTGLHKQTIYGICKALRNIGWIHVEMWAENARGAFTYPVYRLGPGKDAPRPKPLTAAQRQARYRAKKLRVSSVFDRFPAEQQRHSASLSSVAMFHDSIQQRNI